MKRLYRALSRLSRALLAPFAVTDDFGTYRLCWTYEEALEWLAVCGPHACIWQFPLTSNEGELIAVRELVNT
jgi:hypothetical protein